MKLNEGHFSSGTVIFHFRNKHYQEINFKNHLNNVLLCKYGKDVPFGFVSLYLFVLTFAMKLKDANYKSRWNRLVFLRPMKNDVRFEYVPWKMSDIVSFPLFRFVLVIKLSNFDFGSHWNTLIFFGTKVYHIRFEYVLWKMTNFVSFPFFGFTLVIKPRNFGFESHWNSLIFFDKKDMTNFVSFPFFGFTLVIKLRNFGFESHWNSLIFFDKKDMASDLNMSYRKQFWIWFMPGFLSRILTISWEIQLLNFIEIWK